MPGDFIQTRRNPDFVMPNHPTANNLTKVKDRTPTDIVVNKQENIRIKAFNVWCDLGKKGGPIFTAYDIQIYDAICTLYDAGNVFFSAKMVWRVANGMSANRDPHKKQVARVEASIFLLGNTKVSFDASEEIQERGLKIPDKIEDTPLLLLAKDKEKLRCDDGKEYEFYRLNKEPIMLRYSKAIGQVLRVPYGLLNVRKPDGTALHLTEQRMALKGVLMRRITWQRNKSRTFKVSLESIAKDLGTTLSDKRARQILRTDIEIMLEFWKQKKHISDYEPYLKGQTIAGYRIKT